MPPRLKAPPPGAKPNDSGASSNGRTITRDAGATLPGVPAADSESTTTLASGRTETVREWRSDGRLVARLVEVSGLGHAWSGGDSSLEFFDGRYPDATELAWEFFDSRRRRA